MFSLLMLVVFLLVVARCAGACLRLTERSLPRGRRNREAAAAVNRPELSKAAPVVETPLESLQRRFAEGHMSVDQYEREVGRLFGLKSLGPS
jgi:hypothetical protein